MKKRFVGKFYLFSGGMVAGCFRAARMSVLLSRRAAVCRCGKCH